MMIHAAEYDLRDHKVVRWNLPFGRWPYTYVNVHLALRKQTDDGVLIDCGWPGSGAVLLPRIREALGSRSLRTIFLTHAHLDHVGDAAWLAQELGATILAHRGDGEALASGRLDVPKWVFDSRLLGAVTRGLSPRAPVVRDANWHDGSGEIEGYGRIVPLPGHHRNQCGLFLEDGSAFVGDAAVIRGRRAAANSFYDDRAETEATYAMLCRQVTGLAFAGHFRPIDLQGRNRDYGH